MFNNIFLFDLDCTLTKTEILPLIAREIGLEVEMKLQTEMAMKGLIDFETSYKSRIGLIQDLLKDPKKIEKIVSTVPLNEKLIHFINSHSERCYVVTGSIREIISPLSSRIKCPFITSEGVFKDGQYIINKVLNKSNVKDYIEHNKIENKNLVAIGDGFNDIPLFGVSNITIASCIVKNAPQELWQLANYIAYSEESLCTLLNMLSS